MGLPIRFKNIAKLDRADEAAVKQSRKRVAIIALSAVVLVAIVIVAVAVSSRESSGEDSDSAAKGTGPLPVASSIKLVCDSTLYPGTCVNSLSSMVKNNSVDPVTIFHFSVQAAMKGIASATKSLDQLALRNDTAEVYIKALRNCNDLLGLAVRRLNESMGSSTDLTGKDAVDGLKAWLSSSVTYHHTCVDGFGNATVQLQSIVGGAVKNSTEMASNSLAILTSVHKFLRSFHFRKLLQEPTSGNQRAEPRWLSATRRRLLEEWDSSQKNKADLVVAQDGTGDYQTISEAVAAVPDECNTTFVIYVKEGTYYENVVVNDNKWNVMMVGDGGEKTIVSSNLNFVDGTPTYSTATFAALGWGFMARDMGFYNTAGAIKQQAVALMSDSDQSVFYRCRFDAYQDTLYVHSLRQFYRECTILGTVDYIFGNAAVVFQNCDILPRAPLPGQYDTITAQGKVDPNQNTGITIQNCSITPAENLANVQVYLGRPWKPYATTVFLTNYMEYINPAGWIVWNATTGPPDTLFYAEYMNEGPGSGIADRVQWSGVRVDLSMDEASQWTVANFLDGDNWIPRTGVSYASDL